MQVYRLCTDNLLGSELLNRLFVFFFYSILYREEEEIEKSKLMHESFKSSIIDASAGDLQIAVDEPGGFIHFQLGALFRRRATGLNIKRINETLIMTAINQKKKRRGREVGVVVAVVVWGGAGSHSV